MKDITGIMYSYSFLCARKLWYFANNINMESESENVAIGKLVDETTHSRERKHLLIDNMINIDFLKNNVIYEVKKSDTHLEMAINQVKYYIYNLQKKGVEVFEGVISVPSQRFTDKVIFTEKDYADIETRLERIKEIIESEHIPPVINKRECKNCSYFELCYI